MRSLKPVLIYRKLLILYPPTYRRQYGQQMVDTFSDMLSDHKSPAITIYLRAAADLPLSIIKQQTLYIGGIMLDDMPQYVRLSSLVGTCLIAPFFIFLILNSFFNQHLNGLLPWQPWLFFIWIIVLPSIAIAINTVAFAKWSMDRRRRNHVSFWRILFDVYHNWPVISIIVIGFGILALVFGHDSVHCISGNPLREAVSWRQTWQCIQNN